MLRKKDEEKVQSDLQKIIKARLLDGFKNRKHQVVEKVEWVRLALINVDEENENRDILVITRLESEARVYVNFGFEATSSDNIRLRNQGSIIFNYDKETDNFELDENTINLFDITT